MSRGLKPRFLVGRNVRTEVRTYLRNKDKNKFESKGKNRFRNKSKSEIRRFWLRQNDDFS